VSRLELCANAKCGHEKASHYAELDSTGDITKPGKSGHVVHRACMAAWCECKRYRPEKD
jgi:hypothetical protein